MQSLTTQARGRLVICRSRRVDRRALQSGGYDVQELSCVDLSLDIAERCLEIVRGTIEEHAHAAKEKEYQSLLRELDAEEAAKKVGKHTGECSNI